MAGKTGAEPPLPFIKSDEIQLDTSQSPWMAIAIAEMGKNIRELAANDALVNAMRSALTQEDLRRSLDKPLSSFAQSPLLGEKGGALGTGRYRLLTRELGDPARGALGMMEAVRLKDRNPEIMKYFDDVKTDPSYNKKGRSYEMAPT